MCTDRAGSVLIRQEYFGLWPNDLGPAWPSLAAAALFLFFFFFPQLGMNYSHVLQFQ